MEPRGRERHRWASREAEWSFREKRHRRQSREGSSEEAGKRTSFKRAEANESIFLQTVRIVQCKNAWRRLRTLAQVAIQIERNRIDE
jgi:hypothetical protein